MFVLERISLRPTPRVEDITDLVSSSLCPAACEAVGKTRMRVFYAPQESAAVAVTFFRLVTLTTAVAIDDAFLALSLNARSFVICHELYHVRNKDPLAYGLMTPILAAFCGMLAYDVTISMNWFCGAITAVLGVILLLAVKHVLINIREKSADRLAASIVGNHVAVAALVELKHVSRVKSLGEDVLKNIDSRIAKLDRLAIIASTKHSCD